MKKNITLLIVRNSGYKIHQTSFSKKTFSITLILLAAFIVSFFVLLIRYNSLLHVAAEHDLLAQKVSAQKQEIINQREQIKLFADQIESFKSRLVVLNDFEEKIRVIANIESTTGSDGVFGIGGSMPSDLDASLPLEEKQGTLIREMHEQVADLDVAASNQQDDFKRILNFLEEKKNLLASTPTILPISGRVTSGFGYRISPFTGKREFHKGLDIGAPKGSPIRATADGVVAFSGVKGYLGQAVVIDHGYGISTRYGHAYKLLKKKGDHVKRGDVIARVGNTGRSTGPHVHYEVRLNGVQVNPKQYILSWTPPEGKKQALHITMAKK